MSEENIKIRITGETDLGHISKDLREIIQLQRELVTAVKDTAVGKEKETKAIQEQTGILGKLQEKLRDLKRAQLEAHSVEGVKKYGEEIKQTEAKINDLTGTTDRWGTAVKGVGSLLLGAFAVDKILDYGKSLFTTVVETERLHTALKAATTSNEDYIKSVTFLNQISDQYGQNVNILTGSYKNFIAASNTSNLSLEERQRIYGSIVKAGSALQLSNANIEGSLYAVSQMFSKGNVQAEELRGQLGERLSGAFSMMAKAMGVTEPVLNKMLEQGQVLAKDALPLLATELEKAYGSKATANLETVGGAWNRLTNAVIKFGFEANASTVFTKALAALINTAADSFGTIIKIGATAVTTFVAYQVATRGVAAATVAVNAVLAAERLLIGQLVLAKITLTGTTDGLSAAQLRGAASARAFNAALLAHPFVLAATALTTLAAAYIIFKDSAEAALQKEIEFSKGLQDAITPLRDQQDAFNKLSATVLNSNTPLKERNEALKKMQEMHPQLMAGINSVKDAETKLGGVMAMVNEQYVYRIKLEENVYRANAEAAKRNSYIKEEIELQAKLTKAQIDAEKGNLSHLGNIITGGTQVNIQKRIDDIQALKKSSMEYSDALIKESDRVTSKLVTNFGKESKAVTESSVTTKKANKEKEKSTEDLRKALDKSNADMLKDFDKHQRAYLQAIMKGNREEEKEQKELYESQKKALAAQNDYVTKINYLRIVANAKTLDDLKKAEIEYNADMYREQLRAADIRIKEIEVEIKRLEVLDQTKGTDSKDRRTKLYGELEKLQKEYNDASNNLGKQYFTEREEELKKLEDREKFNAEIIYDAKLEGLDAQLTAQRNFGLSIEKLTDEQLDILIEYLRLEKDALEKQKKWREWTIEDTFATIQAISDAATRIWVESLDAQFDKANSATEKALIENKKMWVSWGSQVGNVAQAWGKGIADGIVATVAWAGQGIANIFTAKRRKAEAEMADLKTYYEGIISSWGDYMADTNDDLEKYYGTLMNLNKEIKEYGANAKDIDPKDIIQNEINRAEHINKTYDEAISREKSYHQNIIDHINEQYNQRIAAINKEFDAREEREKQGFAAGSLAIEQRLTDELAKVLTNEESKFSIFNEFNDKKSQILQATALADKVIVEGMSQAEIDAINAARELRAAALLELQERLNQELENTINTEGQKRKVYSETEELRRKAQEEHDLLDLEYSMAQIKRNQEKNQAYLDAEVEKNTAIESEAARSNKAIEDITLARDEAIKASWETVRAAMIAGYDQMMAAAQEAYSRGLMTLDQYRQIINEVNNLRNSVNANTINIPAESDAAYRKWLQDQNKPDNDASRLEYQINGGNWFRYATGTESVASNYYPDGVDTVPALLTKKERVMTVAQNKPLLQAGLNNDQVSSYALNWHKAMEGSLMPSDLPILRISPTVTNTFQEQKAMEKLINMNMQPVVDRLGSIENTLSKLPINNFTLDEKGLRKWQKKGNSVTVYNKKRYEA